MIRFMKSTNFFGRKKSILYWITLIALKNLSRLELESIYKDIPSKYHPRKSF